MLQNRVYSIPILIVLIHEEIFGKNQELNPEKRLQSMNLSVKSVIQDELDEEQKNANDLSGLVLDDRKIKYTKEQLEKFVQFKNEAIRMIGKESLEGYNDNVYCRFLDGYSFNFEEGLKNLSSYTVRDSYLEKWRIENRVDFLKLEDFPEIIAKDFIQIIGKDREGRPIIFFRIRNFTSEGTTAERIALFNGVIVTKALKE